LFLIKINTENIPRNVKGTSKIKKNHSKNILKIIIKNPDKLRKTTKVLNNFCLKVFGKKSLWINDIKLGFSNLIFIPRKIDTINNINPPILKNEELIKNSFLV
jgi:hypothetical protein